MNKCLGAVAKKTGQAPQFFHSAVSAFWRDCTAILKMHRNIMYFMRTQNMPIIWKQYHTSAHRDGYGKLGQRVTSMEDDSISFRPASLGRKLHSFAQHDFSSFRSKLSMAWRSLILEDEIWILKIKKLSVYFRLTGENCPTKWNQYIWMLSPGPHLSGVRLSLDTPPPPSPPFYHIFAP